jgi:circadian clock protein KaiC
VVVATLLSETHDLMLANLRGFRFFEPTLVGDRVQYLNLFDALVEDGLDGVVASIRQVVRETNASLLIIDGATALEDVATSPIALRRFAHVDGVIALTNERTDARHVRLLEVLKLRGGQHVTGTHEFAISGNGLTVFPRLESVAGRNRPPENLGERAVLGTGVAGLDAMLGGGLLPLSSTLVMGTPGAGKTLLGLSFLLEGAKLGERGLIAGFHETEPDLIAQAEGIGLNLQGAVESGLIRILWNPPLELSADSWAWQLLQTVREHRPQRVFVDAVTDIQRFIESPQRVPNYASALTNELRALGATALIATEIDAYVDDQLVVPVPAASATMDNGILLRQVELRSSLHRLVSVLKARQMGTDPAIREFVIGEQGITISGLFGASSGLLTGRATTDPVSSDIAP